MRGDLQARLLQAHGNEEEVALIGLYEEAAIYAEARGDQNAACFYLTHAFVFALQAGDMRADALQYRLYLQGRETCPTGFVSNSLSLQREKAAKIGDLSA